MTKVKLIKQTKMSTTYKCVLKNGTPCFLKEIDTTNPKQVKYFRREIEAYHSLNCPSIPKFMGTTINPEKHIARLFTEYIEGIPLSKCNVRTQRYPIVKQICNIIDNLHEQGFLYRDLSPSNILLTKDNTVRIVDLGGCIKGTHGDNLPEKLGTKGFYNKDIGDIWNTQVDLYSIGCIIERLYSDTPMAIALAKDVKRGLFRNGAEIAQNLKQMNVG